MKIRYTMQSMAIAYLLLATNGTTVLGNDPPLDRYDTRTASEAVTGVIDQHAIRSFDSNYQKPHQEVAGTENVSSGTARFTASPTDFDSHIRVAFHRSMVQGSFRIRLMDEEDRTVLEQTAERPVQPVLILTRELAPGTYRIDVIDGHTGRSIGSQPMYKHSSDPGDRAKEPVEGGSRTVGQRVLALGFFAYPELFTDQVYIKLRDGTYNGMVKVVLRNAEQADVISIIADPRDVIELDTRDLVEGRYEVEVYDLQTGSSIGVQALFRKASSIADNDTSEPDGDAGSSRAQEGLMTSFAAYPNPFAERFTLRFDRAIDTNLVRVTLRDQFSGSRVLFMSADPSRPVLVNTDHLPAGQYVLEVVDGRSGRHLGTMQMRK